MLLPLRVMVLGEGLSLTDCESLFSLKKVVLLPPLFLQAELQGSCFFLQMDLNACIEPSVCQCSSTTLPTHIQKIPPKIQYFSYVFVPESEKNQALISLGMIERGKSTGVSRTLSLETSCWNTNCILNDCRLAPWSVTSFIHHLN